MLVYFSGVVRAALAFNGVEFLVGVVLHAIIIGYIPKRRGRCWLLVPDKVPKPALEPHPLGLAPHLRELRPNFEEPLGAKFREPRPSTRSGE